MHLRALVVTISLGSLCGLTICGCGSDPEPYGTHRQALVTEPTWTALNLVGQKPPARFDHAMAYDSDREVVVLFGGTVDSGTGDFELQDTWEWSLANRSWTEVGPVTCTPTSCPPKRHGHAMVYDPTLQGVVLFGGHSYTAWLNDVWIWKNGAWRGVDQSGTTPPAIRHNHTMVHDPVGSGGPLIWMLGGSVNNNTQSDLWVLSVTDGGGIPTASWTSLGDATLPDRYGHAMAYWPQADAVYVFAGRSFNTMGVMNDLWRMDRGVNCTDVSPVTVPQVDPPRRYGTSLAAYGDVLVAFGGMDATLVDPLGDTWEVTEAAWVEITPAGSPPMARGDADMVATADGLLLFGGRGRPGGGAMTPLNDTYLYERPGPAPVDGGTPDGSAPDSGTPDGSAPDAGGADGGADPDGGPTYPVPRYDCSSAGGGGLLLLALGLIALFALSTPARLRALGRRLGALLLLGALAAPGGAAAREEDEQGRPKMRLAFLGLSPGGGANVDLGPDARSLSEFVQSELGSLDIYDVMGHAEVSGLLSLEEQRQLLGCASDAGCGGAVSSALDAERILSGTLGKVGSRFVLNLTLVDLNTKRNIARTARHARDLDSLLDEVRSALLEIISRDLEIAESFDRDRIPERISPLWETPAEGLLLAPRLDLEVLAQTRIGDAENWGLGVGVGLQLGWRMGRAGVATTLLLKPLGVRLAGRFHPVSLWRFLPYLEGGLTVFSDSLSTRAGLGFELDLRPFRLFFDLAYEYGITSWATSAGTSVQAYLHDSLLVGGGIGWSF
ncbi:MAG: kelch repeat-containing protein [Deltaproteobacteria bacterium]|nr:kelch repeat-containing protein [Deltaproteobacteria bacterium]